MQTETIGVVVPTLNEEPALGRHLGSLLERADDLVVSDGGSRDGTVELARSMGVRVVCGEPGRGGQLNRGAAAVVADVLLFVHADTELPAGAFGAVREVLAGGACGGGFEVRFDSDRALLALGAGLINARSRWLRVPLGDQAQFVRRSVFEELGGFAEWPILEDLDLMRRLKGRGRVAVLPLPVTTAARRFEQRGVARTVATNWLIWGLYFAGVAPRRLARLYRHVR